MKLQTSCAILVLSLLLAGCGGVGTSSTNKTVTAPTSPKEISGNWDFAATSKTPSGTTTHIGGALNTKNGKITGVFHAVGSDCFTSFDNIPITGTIDGQGKVKLVASEVRGQVISADMTNTSTTSMKGTYQIVGGCAGGDTGNVAGSKVPDVSGGWVGSIRSDIDNSTTDVSAALVQSTTVDNNGFYNMTGTIYFLDRKCFNSGNLQNSQLAGSAFFIILQTWDVHASENGQVIVKAILDDPAASSKSLKVEYQVVGGTCAGDTGSGTLIRQ